MGCLRSCTGCLGPDANSNPMPSNRCASASTWLFVHKAAKAISSSTLKQTLASLIVSLEVLASVAPGAGIPHYTHNADVFARSTAAHLAEAAAEGAKTPWSRRFRAGAGLSVASSS